MGGEARTMVSAEGADCGHRAPVSSGFLGVFLLDADGPGRLEPFGFRGQELSMRHFSCEPWSLARELSDRLHLELEVHSILHAQDRVWVVLRRSCRYAVHCEKE